jgi:hypothetical protein
MKVTAIVHQILNCKKSEKIAMDNIKDASINDNHLYRLRDSDCSSEIIRYFTGATGDPRLAANMFRLRVQDLISANSVKQPLKASAADYEEAAKWVEDQDTKRCSLKSAVVAWQTHRNVELKWWKLQEICSNRAKLDLVGLPPSLSLGRRRHMSDYVFLKYVLPIMQSCGPLKTNVETWMDVMCAVDMLTNGMLSVDQSGAVNRYDDGVMKAVWSGELPSGSKHRNQPHGYVPFPKDRSTAVDYLKRFDLNARTSELLGPHRLGADPGQVESVFETLKDRMARHNITNLRNILVTDEFRFKKEMERVFAAIQAVAISGESRAFVQGLQRVVEGATVAPVSNILGDTVMIQIVLRDGDRRTNAAAVEQLFRAAGFTCKILVCYSESGYQTGETNKQLKDTLIDVLGSTFEGWTTDEPLNEHFILIEDGASMHSGGDLAHSLKCLTAGLVIHHVASNSTHFSQLYDRVVFLIAKMLSIKELSIRIQAMASIRPDNAISRRAWSLRIMRSCVLSMDKYDLNDCTLQEARDEFMTGFKNNQEAEVALLNEKLNDIFDMAERRQVDELMLLSAIAPAMFVALKPKYVVQSAKMVGLLPSNFVRGRDDYIACGVWPEYVMKNPLVQLQLQRRQNELNFANNQESAIRETLASVGIIADQQQLSSVPPLSHAGTRAALDAAPDPVWSAFKRSRSLEFDEDTSDKLQALVGDFALFSKQVAREESRTNALRSFVAYNSRTVSACQALLGQQAEEKVIESIASIERHLRVGQAKYNSVLDRTTAAERHSGLFHRAANDAAKQHHLKNLRGCGTAAHADVEGGHDNFDFVFNALAGLDRLEGFDEDTENTVEDLRMHFAAMDSLRRRAKDGYARISRLLLDVDNVAPGIAAIVNRPEADIVPAVDAHAHDAVPAADAPEIDDLVVQNPAPAVVQRPQRRCSRCNLVGHQANNRICELHPFNANINDDDV